MDKKQTPTYRWVILVIVCLIGVLSNYMQYQISAMAISLTPLLKIDPAGFSTLLMMPMLTAVFLSIPMGTLGDKMGPKRVVFACLIVAVIGAFLRTFFLNFPMQAVSMFLLGAGIAALNANLIKILSVWFGEKTQVAMGFFFGAAGVGVILAQMVAPRMSVFVSYLSSAIILSVFTIIWLVLIKDMPDGIPMPPSSGESPVKYFGVAAKSKNVWLIAFCYGFSMAASTSFAGFIPQTLRSLIHFDVTQAGLVASAAAFGSIIGSVIWIHHRLGDRSSNQLQIAHVEMVSGIHHCSGRCTHGLFLGCRPENARSARYPCFGDYHDDFGYVRCHERTDSAGYALRVA